MSLKLEEVVGKVLTEAQFDEAAGEKDACYHKVKARYDVWPSAYASGALVEWACLWNGIHVLHLVFKAYSISMYTKFDAF